MQELIVNLKPSKQAIVLCGTVLLGSLFILSGLSIQLWLKMTLIISVFVYGSIIFWRYILLCHPRSIIKLQLGQESCLLNDQFMANLTGESTVTQWVCILRFKVANHYFKSTSVIFKDALAPGQYRSLLVRVRTMKLHGISSQNALPSAAL